jgi:hypothetical protein
MFLSNCLDDLKSSKGGPDVNRKASLKYLFSITKRLVGIIGLEVQGINILECNIVLDLILLW